MRLVKLSSVASQTAHVFCRIRRDWLWGLVKLSKGTSGIGQTSYKSERVGQA